MKRKTRDPELQSALDSLDDRIKSLEVWRAWAITMGVSATSETPPRREVKRGKK